MKSFEKNSKLIFFMGMIAYLVFKLYMSMNITDELLQGEAGGLTEGIGMIKVVALVFGVLGTIVFVVATYFIYKAIYKKINGDNQIMLERFKGIYFSNMAMLYIGSIIALFLSSFIFEGQTMLPITIGIAVKLFLIMGLNFILIDGEDSRIAPNMATFALLSLF